MDGRGVSVRVLVVVEENILTPYPKAQTNMALIPVWE
jgi:hypothetical protein